VSKTGQKTTSATNVEITTQPMFVKHHHAASLPTALKTLFYFLNVSNSCLGTFGTTAGWFNRQFLLWAMVTSAWQLLSALHFST
jgi:hypothetical protein